MGKGDAIAAGNLEVIDATDLKRALGEGHPGAILGIEVYLGRSDVLVGRAKVADIKFEGPDCLGFHSCKLRLEMSYDDLLTSDALAMLPDWALEKVARTGKPIDAWELHEECGE